MEHTIIGHATIVKKEPSLRPTPKRSRGFVAPKRNPNKFMGRPKKELAGNVYGQLTVVRFAYIRNGSTYWKCICSCGKDKIIIKRSLELGMQSCGCLTKILMSKRSKGNKHSSLAIGVSPFNSIHSSYRSQAKVRGIEFDTSLEFKEEFRKITKLNCHYCGIEPAQIKQAKNKSGYENAYVYNGLDREDSEKGYIFGNVVPCCYACNLAKSDHTEVEFKIWLERAYKHMVKNGSN